MDFQILVRSRAIGKEREGQGSWQSLPKDKKYPWITEKTLWKPVKPTDFFEPPGDAVFEEEVFYDLPKTHPNCVAIVSHGKAEVWAGTDRIIGIADPITTNTGIIVKPSEAVNPGGRAELYFSRPNQSIELTITVNGQAVREVRIVSTK